MIIKHGTEDRMWFVVVVVICQADVQVQRIYHGETGKLIRREAEKYLSPRTCDQAIPVGLVMRPPSPPCYF